MDGTLNFARFNYIGSPSKLNNLTLTNFFVCKGIQEIIHFVRIMTIAQNIQNLASLESCLCLRLLKYRTPAIITRS